MLEWSAQTLRTYPEIALFLALGIGYYVGKFTFRGIGLGAVTSTLLAAVLIGQLGITISPPLKAFVFLMFLFAVGYGVGPQFVRGITKDGVPQALFAAVVCVLCLGAPIAAAKFAGVRPRLRRGPGRGIADDFSVDGSRDRRHQSARTRSGESQRPARRDTDRVRVAYAVTASEPSRPRR
jgi:putative transport protein